MAASFHYDGGGGGWIHKTSLIPPRTKPGKCICVLGVSNIASFYDFDILF